MMDKILELHLMKYFAAIKKYGMLLLVSSVMLGTLSSCGSSVVEHQFHMNVEHITETIEKEHRVKLYMTAEELPLFLYAEQGVISDQDETDRTEDTTIEELQRQIITNITEPKKNPTFTIYKRYTDGLYDFASKYLDGIEMVYEVLQDDAVLEKIDESGKTVLVLKASPAFHKSEDLSFVQLEGTFVSEDDLP